MANLSSRNKDQPWQLKTPPGTSGYTMHLDEKDSAPVLVCTVGSTVLFYDARCIEHLHAMLKAHGDWMELGGADEQKPAKAGTVEAWGAVARKPCGRVVWIEEGPAWPLRCLHSTADGSAGPL